MMKKMLIAVAFLFAALGAQAAPIDSLFARAPESVLPLLDLGNRLDLLDLYNSKMRAEISNVYNGQTLLAEKTPRHLRLQLTAAGTFDLVLLPEREDTVLLVVRTFATPAVSSRLFFFTPQWKPLSKAMPDYKPTDFYVPADSTAGDEREDLLSKLRPQHIEMQWDASSSRLLLSLSTAALTADDRKAVAPYLRTLAYTWHEGRFRRVEPAAP